ncbi:hypothetical protein GF376_02870 [Candidatus Peregrinibacteria bacterium]|nr:hypothetical protein [Candidatus Peregrinibacteria bacterium]
MKNLFEQAAETLNKISPASFTRKKRLLIKELLFILNTAPFLSPTEKNQLARAIPSFSERMIESLKKTIIREGVRFFKDYHATKQ